MLRLYLVRHGQTDWNAQHRYQGHSDLPLNQEGVEQARQLAERLQAEKFDLVFSSDLQRALQTAQILTGGREIQIQVDARLREMNFGMLEGHTFEEGLERWPDVITSWLEDLNQPPAGGERIDDFMLRVSEFLSEIMQSCEEKTVLIVSHGGPLREIIQGVLGTPEGPAWWFTLEHCGLTDLQVDAENIVINRINEAGHLKSK